MDLAQGYSAAVNMLDRAQRRIIDASTETMLHALRHEAPIFPDEPRIEAPESSSDVILCEDFRKWAYTYSGPRFDFIHCDFPFGVGFHTSDQSEAALNLLHETAYDDSPEVFSQLLEALLSNRDRFIAASAHIMFWFPMSRYEHIRQQFTAADFVVDPYPLIWYKSDQSGILPDYRRGPRRVYETAFIASRGDRLIVRPTSNVCSRPLSADRQHVSEKPEDVLRMFFQMFIDGSTRALDPTCGSGTALPMFEWYGAREILGLDINLECVNIARARLNRARVKAGQN
jgi:hypothetical protein